jgi:nicotinamide mononucleotide transporter
MVESVSWILTIIAIYGTYLNANKNPNGFYYWLISNSAFCAINFVNGMMAQGFLFGVYTILAIIGIQKWKEN